MEKQKNIPSLRFPEYRGEWEFNKIGEIAKVSSGGTPSRTKSNYWNGNIPWVSTTLIDFNTIIETAEFITNDGLANSSAKIFPKGTLLMAMYGQGKTRGKVALLGIEATTNQACGAIIPDIDKLNELFLFQNLAGRYDEIRDLSNQGGQENLSGEIIKNILITLPTLSEQAKIANFLTSVDEKLQDLKKKKNFLEQYKKGVMQQIYSQELRFKDDNGNDFVDWEVKTLGEVLIKNSKKNKNQEFKLVQSVSNKHGFVNQDEYFEDRIIASKDLSNYYVIQKGYFAYNPSRIDVGSLAYKFDNNTSVISPLYISFKTDKNYINDDFLLEWFFTQNFTRQMNSSFEGSVRNTLSYESLTKIEIEFPSLEEQTKIANFLSAIDDKINHCQSQIEKTEIWKKGLLQQMFV